MGDGENSNSMRSVFRTRWDLEGWDGMGWDRMGRNGMGIDGREWECDGMG